MILPEIGIALNRNHYACWGADTLELALAANGADKVCPCCGAKRIGKKTKYRCGAEYTSKPQGQTHTEVYWGHCPTRADPWLCEKAGLPPDTPPGVVADKLGDMGLEEDETAVRRQCGV